MSYTLIAVIGILIMLVLLFLGMNIGAAMLIVGVVGYAYLVTPKAALGLLQTNLYTAGATYSLSVVPLFVLMGEFCYVSGISQGLFDCANKWLNRLPGSLACASLVACAGFGAICGSPAATAATMGVVALPEMKSKGYDDGLATGCVSMGGTLGIIIPPSTAFILYGVTAGESIGALFASGITIGIILTIFCCAVVVLQVIRKPEMAPSAGDVTWSERLQSLKGILAVAILFIICIGGIFIGYFTPNEGAAIGCFIAMLYTALKRKLTWKNFLFCIEETAKTVGMTFFIVIGATLFGNFLAISKLPQTLANWCATLEVSRYVVLVVILLIYALLGCIMDAMAMLLLTVPIFVPVISALGFDTIWFGVLMVLVMELGLITPPVGLNCYVMAGIAKGVPLTTIFRGSLPFVISLAAAIAVVVIFPGIATWLPNLLY
ncbi:MAG: TRAP transporter large permease [Oscillospiraceae bacterium]|nr:TRAP transporter large permease [Oscillospiraceae bacterium]